MERHHARIELAVGFFEYVAFCVRLKLFFKDAEGLLDKEG